MFSRANHYLAKPIDLDRLFFTDLRLDSQDLTAQTISSAKSMTSSKYSGTLRWIRGTTESNLVMSFLVGDLPFIDIQWVGACEDRFSNSLTSCVMLDNCSEPTRVTALWSVSWHAAILGEIRDIASRGNDRWLDSFLNEYVLPVCNRTPLVRRRITSKMPTVLRVN